jgi:hypothetical protein
MTETHDVVSLSHTNSEALLPDDSDATDFSHASLLPDDSDATDLSHASLRPDSAVLFRASSSIGELTGLHFLIALFSIFSDCFLEIPDTQADSAPTQSDKPSKSG